MPKKVQSPPIQRKNIKHLARSGRVQSPLLERAKIPKRSKTPERARTPERAKTPDRGKAPMIQVLQPPTPDYMIVEPWRQPPPQALTVQEQRITPAEPRKKKKVSTTEFFGLEDESWEQIGPLAT